MEKIKPCPWCGETEKRRIVRPGLDGRYFIDHFDAVFHLQSSIGFDTEAEAVAAWNNRAVIRSNGGISIGAVYGGLTIERER